MTLFLFCFRLFPQGLALPYFLKGFPSGAPFHHNSSPYLHLGVHIIIWLGSITIALQSTEDFRHEPERGIFQYRALDSDLHAHFGFFYQFQSVGLHLFYSYSFYFAFIGLNSLYLYMFSRPQEANFLVDMAVFSIGVWHFFHHILVHNTRIILFEYEREKVERYALPVLKALPEEKPSGIQKDAGAPGLIPGLVLLC